MQAKRALCSSSRKQSCITLDGNILRNRLNSLGWTSYKLAKEVAKKRHELYGEEIKNPRSLINGINGCLDHPEKSSGKLLNCIVQAMGGSLSIKWVSKRTVTLEEELEENL